MPGPVEFGPTPRATLNWAKHLHMLYEIFWPTPRAVALVAQGPYPPLVVDNLYDLFLVKEDKKVSSLT